MDSKAAFLSALNGGLLAFMWGAVKAIDWCGVERVLALTASAFSFTALLSALLAIAPREQLSVLVGRKSIWRADFKPVSFYGYIARNFGPFQFDELERELAAMDEDDFAREALEQHFNISHVIQRKSDWVFRSVCFTLCALTSCFIGLLSKAAWGLL
jgi:hypothetical protein